MSSAGFEAFELLRPNDEREVCLVVTRWRSEEDFQAWVSGPDFAAGHSQHREGAWSAPPARWVDVLELEGPAAEPMADDYHRVLDHMTIRVRATRRRRGRFAAALALLGFGIVADYGGDQGIAFRPVGPGRLRDRPRGRSPAGRCTWRSSPPPVGGPATSTCSA